MITMKVLLSALNPEIFTMREIHKISHHLCGLDAALHMAFLARDGSKQRRADWKLAAKEFQDYQDPLNVLWLPEAAIEIKVNSGPWREFAIRFLEVSPRHSRSGYLRNRVCHLLKQSPSLSIEEVERIGNALLAGIERRPSVGSFKYDCRLAFRCASHSFRKALEKLTQSRDPWIAGRARRMQAGAFESNAQKFSEVSLQT